MEAATLYEDVRADARPELTAGEGARGRQWPVVLAFVSLALVLYATSGFGLYKLVTALV